MVQSSLTAEQLRLLERASRGHVSLFLPLTLAQTADIADGLVKAGYLEKRPGRWWLSTYDLTPSGRIALDGYK